MSRKKSRYCPTEGSVKRVQAVQEKLETLEREFFIAADRMSIEFAAGRFVALVREVRTKEVEHLKLDLVVVE